MAWPRLPVWLMAVLLVLGTIAVYWPALHNGFIWDDDMHLTKNPHLHDLAGLVSLWTTSAARICPLVLTSFWVQRALWGLVPWPYHLVNILMHAASGLVLWQVLRALKVRGAWFGAALWVLHPVAVESVAWITELKNTQSALFYLLSIWFFVKWRQGALGPPAAGELGGGEVLRAGFAVRGSGDDEQVVHGDSAAGAGAVRVVGGGTLGLAHGGAAGAFLCVFGAGGSGVHVDAKARGCAWCGLCAERSGTAGDGGQSGVVLPGQTGLASPVGVRLSALGD